MRRWEHAIAVSGMNPYLERATAWESFHPNFISAVHFELASQLPPEYVVRVENRGYIHEPPYDARFIGEGIDVEKIGYVAIRDRDGNELVTVIELLSPTNKYAGPDRIQYIGKRNELLRSRTHIVEIDLLRGGPRMPPQDLPTCDYCALVSRSEDRPTSGVWPWRVREPMPVIPIPVRKPHPDAQLDLKAILDRVYDGGRYANYIYSGAPEPQLSPDDAAWAVGLVPKP